MEKIVNNATAAELMSLASLATPMAIRVAATLKLADLVEKGVNSITKLADETGTDPNALARLVRFLARRGIFKEVTPGYVVLTELSRPLLDPHIAHCREWLDLRGAIGRAELAFTELLDCVYSGSPGYDTRFGCGFWEDLAREESLSKSFDHVMSMQLVQEVAAIVKAIDWQGVQDVVDVGGGDGTLLQAVLGANPNVRGILVDLPRPIESARHKFTLAGLKDRVDLIPQSFFDPLPSGADVYLLCGVLSDWRDEDAIVILWRCVEAIGAKGRIFVVDGVVGEGEYAGMTWAEVPEIDLRMLVHFGSRERDSRDIEELAAKVGLTMRSTTSARHLSVMELVSTI
jgi:hypothetical protein